MGHVMIFWPLRRIVKRSAISKTSSSLWDTKRIVMPLARRSRMMRKSAATSFFVSAVVGSSMMISLASEMRARQMATSCLSATDRSPTLASKSTVKPMVATARSAMARKRFQLTNARPAATSVVSARFSMTERLGNTEKSW